MKEKYTITITEENISIDIENGDAFKILSQVCTILKDIVELAPSSVCKDKNDRKNLVKSCYEAVEKFIDEEEEEVPHVHQTLPHLRQS